MSYTPYYPNGWQSGKTGGTPITPEALNHMEQGIMNAAPGGFGLGIEGAPLNGTSEIECKSIEELDNKALNGFWAYRNEDVPLIEGEPDTRFVKGIAFGFNENCTTQIGFCNSTGRCIAREKYITWGPWGPPHAIFGAVPLTRSINSKPLSEDVELFYWDVDAAPAGYGLGIVGAPLNGTSEIECKSIEELNNRALNGFWAYRNADVPLIEGDADTKFVKGIAYAYNPNCTTQFGTCNSSGVLIKREKYKTETTDWGPWDYFNPPMKVGVEYRTTERSGNLPVYAKRISQSVSQNYGSATAMSELYVPHGVTNFNRCVRCTGMRSTYLLPLFDSTSGGSISINRFNSASIVVQVDKMVIPSGALFTFDFYYTKTA